ncbi:hypothetical protein F5Y09DRAFT_355584 [Xylaria sp. FL1042]|nr:hypothetical protein F5Y09DRAFT_355584 [Xylaria sp. FL1042]
MHEPEEWVLEWVQSQRELLALAGVYRAAAQQAYPPVSTPSTSFADISPPFSFDGDSFYAPSDLIDLRASSTLRSYGKPEKVENAAKAQTDIDKDSHRDSDSDISSLDLGPPLCSQSFSAVELRLTTLWQEDSDFPINPNFFHDFSGIHILDDYVSDGYVSPFGLERDLEELLRAERAQAERAQEESAEDQQTNPLEYQDKQ